MLTESEKTEIKALLDSGLSPVAISKKTGRSLGTIYNYRRLQQNEINPNSSQISIPKKLQPFKNILESRIKAGVINSRRLFIELYGKGYKGSYNLVNSYVRQLKGDAIKYKPSIRVETGPGEQAQVDWGSFGKIQINGRQERLYAFVFILSYSRVIYIEFVARQNQKVFHACHINAFEKIGIPRTIRYDNVKTVVLSREKLPDGSRKPHYNPAFMDLASYYGFQPELCPPYWPRAKGKVEASVKYLRYNFMLGMIIQKNVGSLQELNEKVQDWVQKVAHQRIHATTREKPHDLWIKERDYLRFPNGMPRYNISPFSERHSTKDGLVQYRSNLYSVPIKLARRKLFVRDQCKHGITYVEIFYQGKLVATHIMPSEKGKWVIDDEHLKISKNSDKKITIDPSKNKIREVIDTRGLSYYNKFILYE